MNQNDMSQAFRLVLRAGLRARNLGRFLIVQVPIQIEGGGTVFSERKLDRMEQVHKLVADHMPKPAERRVAAVPVKEDRRQRQEEREEEFA